MFTQFIFGKAGNKGRKDQEIHKYRLFLDPLSPCDGDLSELKWKAHLKINQARLISKSKDATVNSTSTDNDAKPKKTANTFVVFRE